MNTKAPPAYTRGAYGPAARVLLMLGGAILGGIPRGEAHESVLILADRAVIQRPLKVAHERHEQEVNGGISTRAG